MTTYSILKLKLVYISYWLIVVMRIVKLKLNSMLKFSIHTINTRSWKGVKSLFDLLIYKSAPVVASVYDIKIN